VPVADAPLGGVTQGAALTGGQTVTLRGEGFLPNSTIQAVIYSTPTPLGSFDTDENGAFEIEVTVPDGLHAGEHSLVVSGLDSNGNPRHLRTDVTVPGSGELLAYTGASVVGPAIGGLAAVVVGSGLIVLSRRRTSA
jgi:titin